MNNPDHLSESLETIFWVKILKFFDAGPESGMEKIRIRDKHPGAATLPASTVRVPVWYMPLLFAFLNKIP
jgi:fumarate hydratase class II